VYCVLLLRVRTQRCQVRLIDECSVPAVAEKRGLKLVLLSFSSSSLLLLLLLFAGGEGGFFGVGIKGARRVRPRL
jgi:hypothetical protein